MEPDCAHTLRCRGKARLKLSKLAEARDDLRAALALPGNNARAVIKVCLPAEVWSKAAVLAMYCERAASLIV